MNQLNTAILLFTLTLGHAWAAGVEGNSNTKLGQGAGTAAGDDDQGVFIGRNAGLSTTDGLYSTFVGSSAGYSNTAGYYNTFLGNNAGYSNLTGHFNTFLGFGAGYSNTGGENTFLGHTAGYYNTTGHANTFLGTYAGGQNATGFVNTFHGSYAGYLNTTGYANTFIGSSAGYSNTTGNSNLVLGVAAGFSNATGNANIFLGHNAGYFETGSNRLYIANSDTTTPLIYGEFNNKKVTLNGNLEVVGPNAGLVRLTDVPTDATTKGARLVLNHYNNAALPVYLFGAASTPGNNFLAFGGGNAIGNAATQLDFFTASNTTTAVGTSRMTINGSGNIGMGVTSPAHPLHMASGALVTSGGVWTNASSRDYKENIKDLSSKEAVLTLASLTPVTYNYKVDKGQAHVGFIAEDVPDLVATKDRKGLSPMDIVAVLTKVVKEQQGLISDLQTQNKLMSERMHQLENSARLNQLKTE